MTVFYEFKHIMITLIAKVKEKTMANKKIFGGMLAIVLVFGVAGIGCADDDSALNGTWYYEKVEIKQIPDAELKKTFLNELNKGYNAGLLTHEQFVAAESELDKMSLSELRQGLESMASNASNMESFQYTKLIFHNGNFESYLLNTLFAKGNYSVRGGKLRRNTTHMHGGMDAEHRLDSRWYLKDEMMNALALDEETIAALTAMFKEEETETDYSVSGNTLKITPKGPLTFIYIRR